MEKLSGELRKKINQYIKNKIDISTLIEGKSLKNEDLSYAIINQIVRKDEDMSGCNLSHCIIGCDNKIATFIRCNMNNCNLEGTKFVGKTWIRHCKARNCNFKNADVANVDYKFSDFREGDFCNAKITISTEAGIGCRFPISMFEQLCKGWKLKITAEETE
jgi:uncharacterized protein YjbI with pentapeptide repeats